MAKEQNWLMVNLRFCQNKDEMVTNYINFATLWFGQKEYFKILFLK